MSVKTSLERLLRNKECYEVFKTVMEGRKTFKQIQEQVGIKKLYFNPNLHKVLKQLESEYGIIHIICKEGKKYYEASPVGEEINKLLFFKNFI